MDKKKSHTILPVLNSLKGDERRWGTEWQWNTEWKKSLIPNIVHHQRRMRYAV